MSVSNELTYMRQLDWFDPDQAKARVTIVGAGGIGSFTAFALAKLGVQHLDLVDFDTVEDHNVPNQLFRFEDIGKPKVNAVIDQLLLHAGVKCQAVGHNQNLGDGVPIGDVVISALDSMEARAALWEQVKGKFACKRFLDGRLAGEQIVLYSAIPFDPDDIAGYEATLHSDDEGLEMPCTRRSIIDVGFSIASLMTRAVRRHYAGLDVENTVVLNQETLELISGGWPG